MSLSKPAAPQQLTAFGHALAGALGGVFSNAVVYPLDTVKTRIQATDDRKGKGKAGSGPSISSLLVKILREEGVGGYYKGFGASMLNTFSMQYAYFFFYSFVRDFHMKRVMRSLPKGAKMPALSTAMELILGALAGALAQIFTIPVSVIATRQQLAVSGPPSDLEKAGLKKPKDNSFLGVGREIVREDGVAGLWTGIKPGLILTVNPAITYGAYERLKTAMVAPGTKISPWMAFALGATSKTLATIVTYPYIMAKVRLQARPADDSGAESLEEGTPRKRPPPRYSGAVDVLRKVMAEKGLIGWYQVRTHRYHTSYVISNNFIGLSRGWAHRSLRPSCLRRFSSC
ncbi:ADP/ATP carrier protein [Tulasnella sp. JGI-2019a]|nr:ADP/ATP carrier protein [Tulasnella sp. JGI-2019a]